MKDYQSYNSFCMKCEQENVLYRVQEGWTQTTLCLNCGIICVKTQKINFKEDKSRGIIDRDTFIGRCPSSAMAMATEKKVG